MFLQSDATPTYRGYRLQALYTLARVLELTGAERFIYQPEGKEDLAVFDSQHILLEIVQVKARSQALTLSDFEPKKKDSFFYRVAAELKTTPDVQISIATYGDVGPVLRKAIDEDGRDRMRVAESIAENGYLSVAEAALLLSKTRLILANEADLMSRVYTAIRRSMAGADADSAFELMTYWLYISAENRDKITQEDVIKRINAAGRFVASREAYIKEWLTSIVPLEDKTVDDTTQRNELADEFYRGISARYDHILADLDIVRGHKLREIETKYKTKRVVIIHAASGQGKTTLAYRYIHEFCPSQWRFRVKLVANREHALSVALALTAHADAIGIPLTVYIDVAPQDRDWPELVKELSVHRSVRVLVTVREEDWRRANVSGAQFGFEEVDLSFEEEEARLVYKSLAQKRTPVNVLDFEDAWNKFGGAGPLLEFTYLVTQGSSLRDRLSQQIAHLQNEVREGRFSPAEIELLRLTSVAAAFEARLQLRPLVENLHLPAPQSTLNLFEKEYLLRTADGGASVEGLHPIRSMILTDLLSDPTLSPWTNSASKCLPLILEQDVEGFLLYAFSRRFDEIDGLMHSLAWYQPDSWIGLIGVTRSLIWLGIFEYVEKNAALIEEAGTEIGIGWSLFLDYDIANVSEGAAASWWKGLSDFSDEMKQRLDALQARQTDKHQVFERAIRWLSGRSKRPSAPVTEVDWAGAAETAFWIGRLGIACPLREWISEAELDQAVGWLPLETLANLTTGITISNAFPAWLERNRQRLVDRFRHNTRTVLLEDDGQKLTAHFIFALPEVDAAPSDEMQKRLSKAKNAFHEEAIRRIGLLRRLLPDREEFASRGYGHMLWEGFLEFDETVKGGVSRKDLPLMWLVSVNALFRGLAERRLRPDTWPDFAQSIHQLRRAVLNSLRQLERGLELYFRRRSPVELLGGEVNGEAWDDTKKLFTAHPRLPLTAVDEWGFVDESTVDLDSGSVAVRLKGRSGFAMQRYKPFLKAVSGHTFSLSNFFSQAVSGMRLNPYLGRADRKKVLEAAATLGLDRRSSELATLNLADAIKTLARFQHQSRQTLGRYFSGSELDRLESEEQTVLRRVWNMWYFFTFHPEKVMQNAAEECSRETVRLLKTIRLDLRGKLRRLSTNGLRISIVSETIHWDDQPALWLAADGRQVADVIASLAGIIDAVGQAVRKVRKTELRRYTLETYWPYVVIIPLIRGKSVTGMAWRIILPVSAENDGHEMKWTDYSPQQIPPEAFKRLKIESWDLPQLSVQAKLVQSTTELSLVAAHTRDFNRLPDLDEQGLSQLQAYIDRLSEYGSEALQSVLDAEADMLVAYNKVPEAELGNRPALTDAALSLVELHKNILPSPDFERRATMNLEGLTEWASRLDNAPLQALAASSSWITDILDQMGV